MRHTLTAVFDGRGDAQHALNKLLAAGYSRADAILSVASPTGEDVANPPSHSDASAGKRHVLTLTTESEPEAERAVALVGRLVRAVGKENHGFLYRIGHRGTAAADLKAQWISGHAGELPPWERFKDALFHGWGRISLGKGETEAPAASVDELAPAYRFGNEMHHTEKFRSRGWDEAENELHDNWDSRYGGRGLANWDRNKAAVRQGWDRTTSAA